MGLLNYFKSGAGRPMMLSVAAALNDYATGGRGGVLGDALRAQIEDLHARGASSKAPPQDAFSGKDKFLPALRKDGGWIGEKAEFPDPARARCIKKIGHKSYPFRDGFG